jgi:hypothetical protein
LYNKHFTKAYKENVAKEHHIAKENNITKKIDITENNANTLKFNEND